MIRVAIVDNRLCNLDSITRAVQACGASPVVTHDPGEVLAADMLILPGVGHFGTAMANLRALELDTAIRNAVEAGAPLLGICLGMQLLAASSEESPGVPGLGLISGTVVRLREGSERIPHIGWNRVERVQPHALFEGIADGIDLYFVHSYHLVCENQADVIATTPYCGGFTSAVRRGNVAGTQFHPEKSQAAGFAVLRNFLGSEQSAAPARAAQLSRTVRRHAQNPNYPHPAAQRRGSRQRRSL